MESKSPAKAIRITHFEYIYFMSLCIGFILLCYTSFGSCQITSLVKF